MGNLSTLPRSSSTCAAVSGKASTSWWRLWPSRDPGTLTAPILTAFVELGENLFEGDEKLSGS